MKHISTAQLILALCVILLTISWTQTPKLTPDPRYSHLTLTLPTYTTSKILNELPYAIKDTMLALKTDEKLQDTLKHLSRQHQEELTPTHPSTPTPPRKTTYNITHKTTRKTPRPPSPPPTQDDLDQLIRDHSALAQHIQQAINDPGCIALSPSMEDTFPSMTLMEGIMLLNHINRLQQKSPHPPTRDAALTDALQLYRSIRDKWTLCPNTKINGRILNISHKLITRNLISALSLPDLTPTLSQELYDTLMHLNTPAWRETILKTLENDIHTKEHLEQNILKDLADEEADPTNFWPMFDRQLTQEWITATNQARLWLARQPITDPIPQDLGIAQLIEMFEQTTPLHTLRYNSRGFLILRILHKELTNTHLWEEHCKTMHTLHQATQRLGRANTIHTDPILNPLTLTPFPPNAQTDHPYTQGGCELPNP